MLTILPVFKLLKSKKTPIRVKLFFIYFVLCIPKGQLQLHFFTKVNLKILESLKTKLFYTHHYFFPTKTNLTLEGRYMLCVGI